MRWKDARREGEREKVIREKEESVVFFSLKLKAEATYAGLRIYHVVVNNNPSSARTPEITRATVCYFFLPLDGRPMPCGSLCPNIRGARDAPFDRCFRGSVLFNSCLIVSRQTNPFPFFFPFFSFLAHTSDLSVYANDWIVLRGSCWRWINRGEHGVDIGYTMLKRPVVRLFTR